jgi:acetolactate synthase-1/2/3 large subunit
MQRLSTAEAIVAALIREGVKEIFCLPGIQNDIFFDALHARQSELKPIHTRHEQGAAYMALGAAMATGKPAVYCVVPGPGFLNTTAALATAQACNAPVLALVGQIPQRNIGRMHGLLHELPDQLAIMRQLTRWAERIRSPGEAPALMAEAFRQLNTGRPRPVALECAIDVWGKAAEFPAVRGPFKAEPLAIDHQAIDKAVEVLKGSLKPLIVVGGGAQDASQEVKAVAEALGAPVLAVRMGRGVLDSRHPLSVTSVAGHRLWKDCDVVLAVGTRLQVQLNQWGTDENLKIVRVDIDAEEVDRIAPPTVGITGDAAHALRLIAGGLRGGAGKRPSRQAEIDAARQASLAEEKQLEPQRSWVNAIRAGLPEDGIFVDELTQIGYASRVMLPVYRPRSFLSPGYQGTLGWGYGAALGVKVARPDAPVLSVNGDGGFMFNLAEISTAVRHRIPVVAIVFDDGAFGNVRRIQINQFGNRTIASDLLNPDFVKLAQSFGARGVKAQTPEALTKAIAMGFEANEPTIIHVPVGAMPDPWKFFMRGRVRGRA